VFEWFDFLDLAETLAETPNNEAAARTAISRAYYATFHAGRTYLSRTDTPIDRSRNAHLQVLMQLQQRNDEIGQVLALLHSWRKQADYENPTIPDARELARSAVAFARDTIAAIEALP